MIIKIPANVNSAIITLQKAGFAAFAVGGAVRDAVMGRECADWDVTTSALPEQVEAVFSDRRVIETGIKHGTVTVLLEGEPVEITTFRVDGKYTDNRHPDSVSFTSRLTDDLSRRDFTVNALAYNDRDGLVDAFGGVDDINARLIRCVGDPDRRFNEDALRIMRAVRFASVLGFDIHADTEKSIIKNKELLKNVSVERIAAELFKLLRGSGAAGIIVRYAEVFTVILPELEAAFTVNAAKAEKLLSLIPPEPCARFAALAVLSGSPDPALTAENTLRRLRCSNQIIKEVTLLCSHSSVELAALPPAQFKKVLGAIGRDAAARVLGFQGALFSPERAQSALARAEKIFGSEECLSVSQLKIKGSEIAAAGAAGSRIGETLNALLDEVLCGKIKNEKETLLARAAELNMTGDAQND